MAYPQYTSAAIDRPDTLSWLRSISTTLNRALDGRLNVTSEFTIPVGVIAYQVLDARCHSYSSVALDPLTANAMAALLSGEIYILEANRNQGSFTVTCDSSTVTDRKFRYTIMG